MSYGVGRDNEMEQELRNQIARINELITEVGTQRTTITNESNARIALQEKLETETLIRQKVQDELDQIKDKAENQAASLRLERDEKERLWEQIEDLKNRPSTGGEVKENKKAGKPTHFSGKRSEALGWFMTIKNYLRVNENYIKTDMEKVQLALSYMTEGEASKFRKAFYKEVQNKENFNKENPGEEYSEKEMWGTWKAFDTRFWNFFKPHDEANAALEKLQRL